MAAVVLKRQSSDRQSLQDRVLTRGPKKAWLQRWYDPSARREFHQAPAPGIMRDHASHKGSSLVYQPQFNKADQTNPTRPVPLTLTGRETAL